ncbi:MAG TPA: hypothetical protein VL379_00715 [Pseudomonadales bacterium]|nr:hypothetical protein [Pseudomonadales bacterium]
MARALYLIAEGVSAIGTMLAWRVLRKPSRPNSKRNSPRFRYLTTDTSR